MAAGAGVAESTGLGRGVAVIEGSAVGAAGTEGVGVATGSMVARDSVNTGSRWTTCDAAKTCICMLHDYLPVKDDLPL